MNGNERREGAEARPARQGYEGAGERTDTIPHPAELIALNEQGETYRAMAAEFGTSVGTIAGRIRDYRKKRKTQTELAMLDNQAWQDGLAALPSVYKVAFPTDAHMPDDLQPEAWDLMLQIVGDYQPDMCIVGSDAFDLRSISLSHPSNEPEDKVNDLWQATEPVFTERYSELVDAVPDSCLLPFLVGNHDLRMWDYFTEQAPQMRESISEMMIKAIRSIGALWLGWDACEFDLDPLIIKHGESTAKNAAQINGDAELWEYDILTGHTHRFQMAVRSGRKRSVTSITSPALCKRMPTYKLQKKRSKKPEGWQQGLTLATVDTLRGVTHFEPVIFSHDYSAVFGGKMYTIKRKAYR